MNEGLRLAEDLLQDGMDVTVAVDAAMKEAVSTSDIIFIGADTFSDTFIVNKIGTTALALLAKELNKPMYCMTTTNKYVPPYVKQPEEEDHDRSEVWPGAPNAIKIRNRYFETTPIALLTDLITEKGYFKAKNNAWLQELRIDDWLRKQF